VVQPFDYSIRSTAQGPLQALSQGMQLGQQFAQIAEAREAAKFGREMALEKQRIEAEKLRQAQEAAAAAQEAAAAERAARQAYFANPTATKALEWQATLTPQMAKELNPGIERLNAEQIAALNKDSLRDYALLTSGRADMVVGGLMTEARARRDAGDEVGARRLEAAAEMAKTSPKAAAATLLAQAVTRPGGTALVESFNKAMQTLFPAEQSRIVSSAEQKRELNLLDDEGKPLPGTFFVEAGKEPKLIQGLNQRPEAMNALQKAQAYRDTLIQKGQQDSQNFKENEAYIRNLLVDPNALTAAQIRANEINERRIQLLEQQADPNYVAALERARASGRAAGESEAAKRSAQNAAVATLASIGYNPTTGEDDISRLIAKSVSGGAQAGLAAIGRFFNISTEGMTAISELQAAASAITLGILDGNLGAGISNPDREFILTMLGDIGNPNKTSAERYAAWTRAKNRMIFVGMLPRPNPRGTEQSGASAGGAPTTSPVRRETTTTLPTPADQTAPLPPGGARVTPAPGGRAPAPTVSNW